MNYLVLLFLLISYGAPESSEAYQEKSVYSGSLFYYYDQEDRIKVLESFYDEVKSRYSLWEIKKSKIGVDGEKVFQEAIEKEKAISDRTLPLEQAIDNLAFLDRVRVTVATFQDSHLKIMPILKRPLVTSGLTLTEVRGKFVITAMNEPLLAKNPLDPKKLLKEPIALGDEVLLIDDVNPEEKIKELAPYISASSPLFRREKTISSLTSRDFFYPQKNYLSLLIDQKATGKQISVKLPWYFDKRDPARDALYYLKTNNFFTTDELKIDEVSTGFNSSDAPSGLRDEKNYYAKGNKNQLILKTGFFIKKGKSYSFLMIKSYKTRELTNSSENLNFDFLKVIQNFVAEAEELETPLIIDLRYNGGGQLSLPAEVMKILAKSDEKYPPTTVALRITQETRQQREFDYWPEMMTSASPSDYQSRYLLSEELERALSMKKVHTRAIKYSNPIETTPEFGGFSQPIIALISPYCISACDLQSILFKQSKRVILMGSQSNGTGAGFTGVGPYDTSPWQSPFKLFEAHIPTSLFGRDDGSDKLIIEDEDSAVTLNSENIPTKADIPYEPTVTDFLFKSKGWIEKSIDTLQILEEAAIR